MKTERPPVSLSQALHCRMEIWLNAHGFKPESVQPGTQRTFDVGNMVEAAFFDGDMTEDGRPWFYGQPEILDPVGGWKLVTSEFKLEGHHRQREVSLWGLKGHLDNLLVRKKDGFTILPDMKTASGFSYDRAAKGDLSENVFSREYLGQLHVYRRALEEEGQRVDLMCLIYFNKEQSQLMVRFVKYEDAIVKEAEERLAWRLSEAAPPPDWEWKAGDLLPLRCGYCSQKANCALQRAMSLDMTFKKTGAPMWTAKAKGEA